MHRKWQAQRTMGEWFYYIDGLRAYIQAPIEKDREAQEREGKNENAISSTNDENEDDMAVLV